MSVVGTVEYLASIDTSKLSKDASTVEKKVNDVGSKVSSSGKKSFSSFASSASGAFGSIADGIAGLAKVVSATVISGSFGLSYFIKQASELQSVRASFESLTGSAVATDSAMQQLYNFSFKTAFSTADINQAARMYLAAGVSVDQLGSYLQRVGDVAGATGADLLGLVLPLTQAIGKGKLQTQDWYQIVNQGAGGIQKYIVAALGAGHSTKTFMDDLSAGAVTTDILNQALTAASASGGMAFNGAIKQAQTFNGRVSNLLESIKNVALEVLDVDSATGKVKVGGTFDQISKSVKQAQDWVVANKAEIKKWANIIVNNVIPAISALAAAFVVAKLAYILFKISAAVSAGTLSLPMLALAAVITIVIGVLTFLQVKFNIFGKTAAWLKSVWSSFTTWFSGVFDSISNLVTNVSDNISKKFTEAKNSIIKVFDDIWKKARDIFNDIKKWVDDNRQGIINWSIVIGTLLLPKFVALGIEAVKALAKIVTQLAVTSAQSIVEAAKTVTAWVIGAAQVTLAWVTQTLPKLIAAFVTMAIQSTINAAKAIAGWVVGAATTLASWAITFAGMIAGFVMTGIQALISAGKVAAAWLLAMGPVGLIIAIIIGVAALIIANWDTVKVWLTSFWNWLSTTAINAWNAVKNVFSTVGSFFAGVFNTVKSIFTSIGSTVGNAIGNAFKNAINGVLRFAVNMVNDFIDGINAVVGIINAIPGVEIGKIGRLPIPQLADGGIVSSPTLAMIGEGKESEAVIPLSKLNSITGNGTSANNRPINITLNMDGIMAKSRNDVREIAKDMIGAINEELKAKNVDLIGGGAL